MEDTYTEQRLEEGAQLLASGQNPWPVEVDVYLIDDSDPKDPTFKIRSTLPSKDPGSDHPILIFENEGRPGFDIRFYLCDQTGKGYQFAKNKADAVWSTIGENGCPTSEAHEVFQVLRVDQSGTMVVVRNDNKEKDGEPIGPFRYSLNVSVNGQRPYLCIDPGGEDRDGPRTLKFR